MNEPLNTATWVIAGAAVAQVLLAFALVWATNRYVKLTNRLVESSEGYVKVTSRLATSSEEQIRMDKTPNLVFEVRRETLVSK